MATEAIEATGEKIEFKPCPFCDNQPEKVKGWQTERVSCRNRSCGLFNVSILIKFWNTRTPTPNPRQRAERAARRIHEHLTGSNPHQVHEKAIADIIATEFEKP